MAAQCPARAGQQGRPLPELVSWRTSRKGVMVQTLRDALAALRDLLGWAPNNVTGGVILLAAAIIALLLHSLMSTLVRRVISARHPYLAGILAGTRHLSQLAFLVIAMFIALPIAPFDDAIASALLHLLLVAAIILAGWIAIAATHIVAELYLLRFRLDVADNLLARKHVTQVRVLRR